MLGKQANWHIDSINTIDVYANSGSTYSFPNLEQLLQVIPDTFDLETIHYGNYELADSWPLISWSKIE